MAESQTPFSYTASVYIYTDSIFTQLEASLSSQRFTPYLVRAGHDKEYAFNLYLYNARLSKSFLFLIHVLEVSLRNAMNNVFKADFTDRWPWEPTFHTELTQSSLDTLHRKLNSNTPPNNTEEFVSNVSFEFWSGLFYYEYHDFWRTRLNKLFTDQTVTRSAFKTTIRELNKFRNRIAHHEPIHHLDLNTIHTEILDTLTSISPDMAEWAKNHSSYYSVIRTKPSKSNEYPPYFHERCDKNFTIVSESTKLTDIPRADFILCKSENGEISAVLDMKHIGVFLLSFQEGNDLMIELHHYSLTDVIQQRHLKGNYLYCGEKESLSAYSYLSDRSLA